ncbi:hypothetical protein J5A68_12800 [Prevotella melaninogenica]|uniref:hypothetical protein n=1 Tax=Prevotella melaninogenica TaxID=28132 RepID=UPI001BAA0BFC|nr:hypothetical protein [Prevotella melaninogenica]QUB69247.1 hypothetical protein J5A68_12800 [Prevotella melaninogenica]
MELKDFIKQVLSDIAGGITEAQTENETTAWIVPTHIYSEGASSTDPNETTAWIVPTHIIGNNVEKVRTTKGYVPVCNIDFDVAVTSETNTKSSDGMTGGIKVVELFQIGGKSQEESSAIQQNVSRVKFSIPMMLPST